MWDTCKGWWEGKIKVEVDEVLLLQRCRVVNSVSQCTSTAVVQYSCRSTAVYSVAEFVEQYSVAEFASAIYRSVLEYSCTVLLPFLLS